MGINYNLLQSAPARQWVAAAPGANMMQNNLPLKSLLMLLLFVYVLLVACSVSFSTANVGDV